MPLFNDEEFVAASLDSCIAQSLSDIEIICVDDASTDGTVEIVEAYQRRDPRIRLIRQATNSSAFQARRTGIDAAYAPFILFLDGDDELAPHAARIVLKKAMSTNADVVGFGVDILTDDSQVPRRFEAALQPKYTRLDAPNIVPSLFPAGEVANGHLWRFLFSTAVLRSAYAGIDTEAKFYRANDLPITLLAIANAKRYVSTTDRLYKYHFRRGTSGHAITDVDRFRFLLSGVDPITAVRDAVTNVADRTGDGTTILRSYESARLHIIGNVLRSCIQDTSGELQVRCLEMLVEKVGVLDAVRAAAAFCELALPALSSLAAEPQQPAAPVRNVLLTTAHLDTGGLQAVLIDQATRLSRVGINVTIAVLRDTQRDVDLPDSVDVIVLSGNLSDRLDALADACRQRSIDLIIDHHLLYNDRWPWFALTGLAIGVPTVGWLHNFALRPIFDYTQRTSFLAKHLRLLLRVVTLSPVDVAFWKLQGVERAWYLPNPPSPLMMEALKSPNEITLPTGRLELAWWGRLDGPTKQVDHLIDVAAELRDRSVDFRLRIIGPDSKRLRATDLRDLAIERGVADHIDLPGERHSDELLDELSGAHLLVSTSAIEGFQLTILEAQALGLPVVMYDLPWLTTVRGNPGLVTTAPDDPALLAEAITQLAEDPQRYAQMSSASHDFAVSSASVDIEQLLVDLLNDRLPGEYSPTPTTDDARILVTWLVRYTERLIRGVVGSDGSPGELATLRRQAEMARSELRHITSGPSYRLGRAITFLPRKIRQFIHNPRERRRSP